MGRAILNQHPSQRQKSFLKVFLSFRNQSRKSQRAILALGAPLLRAFPPKNFCLRRAFHGASRRVLWPNRAIFWYLKREASQWLPCGLEIMSMPVGRAIWILDGLDSKVLWPTSPFQNQKKDTACHVSCVTWHRAPPRSRTGGLSVYFRRTI